MNAKFIIYPCLSFPNSCFFYYFVAVTLIAKVNM